MRSPLTALSALLLAATAACSGCAAFQRPGPKPVDIVAKSAYRVLVDCDGDGRTDVLGSATAIGPRTFLTARHVARSCAEWAQDFPSQAFAALMQGHAPKASVRDTWGNTRQVYAEATSELVDVSRLVLDDSEKASKTWAKVRFGDVSLGERVQMFAGDGLLQMIWKDGIISGSTDQEILVSVHGVPGNSGSGIFDSEGRLVAVLWGGRWDSDGEFMIVATRPEKFRALLGN